MLIEEDVALYYQTHSQIETKNKFNISMRHLANIIDKFGVNKKIKFNYDKTSYNKSILDYYQTHTCKETCNKFNINKQILNKLIKVFGYSFKKKSFDSLDVSSIIEYYQTHNLLDTCHHFHISQRDMSKIMALENYHKNIPLNLSEDYIVNKLKTLNKLVTRQELANILQVDYKVACEYIYRYNLDNYIQNTKSYYEDSICDFIKSQNPDINIIRNKRLLDGLEIDIYLPDYKLGIEFNGDYWHSDLFKDKEYHLNKSKLAQEKGIHLVHIWEHEWDDFETQRKVKLFLDIMLGKAGKKIYARNCTIRQITNKEAKPFNEQFHLQGHRNAQVTYGLFYSNELVQLMSFSKTKYNRNLKGDNDWEIIRGCPGSNNIVVGGVSKLFSHFVKDYNPDSVFSYCDFNKFDGKSYEALGMKFIGCTGPDKKWLLEDKVLPRNPSKYKELKEKALGIIWGAGSKKYLWTKKENIYVN